MTPYAFRIVNVFAEARLEGNPLAVFEDAQGLADDTMQALALQLNLSETTFILPSSKASARVRIFTPSFEMPFAGHPTLGTAHIVRALKGGDSVSLEMRAGVIPVTAQGDVWSLKANAPRTRPVEASRKDLAAMLGLAPDDVSDDPLWVDTGSEQLVVPLATTDSVRRAHPDPALLARHGSVGTPGDRAMAYVWAWQDERSVLSRFFFPKQGAAIEDPGTGSACANLGGFLIARGHAKPLDIVVHQGEAVARRCKLGLRVDATGDIFVSGRVIELARGVLTL